MAAGEVTGEEGEEEEAAPARHGWPPNATESGSRRPPGSALRVVGDAGSGGMGTGMWSTANVGDRRVPVPKRPFKAPHPRTAPTIARVILVFTTLVAIATIATAQHHHGYTHKYSTRVVRTKYGALRGVVVFLPSPNSPTASQSAPSASSVSASSSPATGFSQRRRTNGGGPGGTSKSVRSVHSPPRPTSSSSAPYSHTPTFGDATNPGRGQYGKLTSTVSTLPTSGRHPRSAYSPEPTKEGGPSSVATPGDDAKSTTLTESAELSTETGNSSTYSEPEATKTVYEEWVKGDSLDSQQNVQGEEEEEVGVEPEDSRQEEGVTKGVGGGRSKWRKGKRRKRRRRRSGASSRRPRPFRPARQRHPYAVEAFLGVPYATPPLGRLRYMPPLTPSPWRGTKVADTLPPVCPQRGKPRVENATEALLAMPRGRLRHLRRLLPLLQTSSEDCLYLNVYVPLGRHGGPPPAPPPTTTPTPQPTSGHHQPTTNGEYKYIFQSLIGLW
ncbi:hypothetical protein J437_LFUL015973 [Ladona fulva]|uniref:Carboxylesterase type B domain-containing protein n=1 Tax=Ladona fulva TaxID=123851 RepID=A0A8K0KHK3_LADFU|nr:hypothetical protein J437_LFUL015973 [Ladona fulva]